MINRHFLAFLYSFYLLIVPSKIWSQLNDRQLDTAAYEVFILDANRLDDFGKVNLDELNYDYIEVLYRVPTNTMDQHILGNDIYKLKSNFGTAQYFHTNDPKLKIIGEIIEIEEQQFLFRYQKGIDRVQNSESFTNHVLEVFNYASGRKIAKGTVQKSIYREDEQISIHEKSGPLDCFRSIDARTIKWFKNAPKFISDIQNGLRKEETKICFFNRDMMVDYSSIDEHKLIIRKKLKGKRTTEVTKYIDKLLPVIYPEISLGIFNLYFGKYNRGVYNINIYNIIGKKINSFTRSGPVSSIDLGSLTKGSYIMSISDAANSRIKTKRITIINP